MSHHPHHAHHAALLPQHSPLLVPLGHHDDLPLLLLPLQLQPKRQTHNMIMTCFQAKQNTADPVKHYGVTTKRNIKTSNKASYNVNKSYILHIVL